MQMMKPIIILIKLLNNSLIIQLTQSKKKKNKLIIPINKIFLKFSIENY